MEKSFHSASWYRVADLRLRLRSHARFFRTHYRGQLWYVLQDRTSGRFHRFSPSSYLIVSLLDGDRTMREIWDVACAQLDDDTLTQDEIIRLLGQLHAADVLLGDVPPDFDELVERGERQRRRKRMSSVMNPLAVRIPLFDPDGFITVTFPLVRPLFSIFGALLFLGIVSYGITTAALHWSELTENVVDRLLTAESVILLLLAYPCIKALHELGHAYCVKRWGGEVHEIGIMMLVLMPVPYVDASDSLAFQEKWRRALVGAAGIMVELFLAAVAMIVWVNAEEGLVRAFAFNVMLIGGVSTLLFNGNPLLKFDAYYVLSDILEIPNLGTRANRYLGYLVQRYAFGVPTAVSPATAPGEPFWFIVYGILSFCYRMYITFAIVLLVSGKFFSLGVILALWAVTLMFGVPIVRHLWFLFASPVLRRNRGRALSAAAVVCAGLAVVLFAVPLPHATVAQGVVWVPGDAVVYAEVEGVVAELLVPANAEITVREPLIRLEDPLIDARVDLLEAYVVELGYRLASLELVDPAEANIVEEELRHANGELALAERRRGALLVRAEADGRFVLPNAQDLVGRFVRRGDPLGYVTRFRDPLIRAIVTEDRADLVRRQTWAIDLRFASAPAESLPARIEREVPAMTASLPSLALSTEGGGMIVLDPTEPGNRATIENLMHLDLRIDTEQPFRTIGERVFVRFRHDDASIAARLYTALRQVFLKEFEL